MLEFLGSHVGSVQGNGETHVEDTGRLFAEVTATPAPVRRLQVIEGVQGGVDGAPSTAVSGQPPVLDVPGINTSPLTASPAGTPPPGVCGVPRAFGGAVDMTGALPEGPISTVSGGFRLRNVPGGGPREVRLVTNCEQCANLIGQNPGRLTPTGFPPDAVLTVLREPIPLRAGGEVPVGGRIVINSRGQPTYNGQPIELPTNTEFGFTPPPRWADGLTLGVPAPASTIQIVPPPPVDGAAAASGAAAAGSGSANR